MRHLLPAALLPLLLAGCAPAAPATLTFPHEAVRIDGVCTGDTGTHGLSVSVEAPFASGGQRRFRIVNGGGAAHEVVPQFVVSNVGRCDRGWDASRKHALQDTGTCSAPVPATLAPGQSVEIGILPHRERAPGRLHQDRARPPRHGRRAAGLRRDGRVAHAPDATAPGED